MAMKIGILTYHRPCNFGANLQAYASICYLKSLGHEAKVIDYVRAQDISYTKKVSKVQFEAHRQFVETRLPLTRQARDGKTLCDIVVEEKFDAILIGADAVWREPEDDCVFFAKWLFLDERTKNIPVCSISAAHMGKGFQNATSETRENIKKCLDRFNYITVRDEWTRFVINRDIYCGQDKPMILNPDPVFMLSHFTKYEAWDSRGLEDKKYILMTLPKNWLKNRKERLFRQLWFWRFKRLVNKAGFQLVEFPIPDGESGMHFDSCIEYPIDSLQWFLFIQHARAFIGLRFHAIVSSISCSTPFYSIDSYGDMSGKRLWLDRFGMHGKARALDVHSKIRNLLVNSSFETYRTGHIECESPTKVFDKLMNVSPNVIKDYCSKQQGIFESNIATLLEFSQPIVED